MPTPYDYYLQLNKKFGKDVPEDEGTSPFPFSAPQDNPVFANADKFVEQLSPEQIKTPVSPDGLIGDDLSRSLTADQKDNIFRAHAGSAPFWNPDHIKSIANDNIPIDDEKNFVLPLNTTQTPNVLPETNKIPSLAPSSQPLEFTSDNLNTTIGLNTINGARNQPSSFDLAKLASGEINDSNNSLIYELIRAKNFYNAAQEGQGGDADRKAAADYATYIRNLAKMNNVSLGSSFDDGNNLSTEQANLAWGKYVLDETNKAQQKFQSVQDNLKNNFGESSNQHYWRLYDEYRQNGDSDRTAAIKAGRETMNYQQNRVQSLQSAIDDYGIEGGTMNQFGVSLLGQLAEEDNIMGSAYANAYATPKLNFEKQQAIAQETLRQTSADRRKAAEIQANAVIQKMLEAGRQDRAKLQSETSMRNTDVKEESANERFNTAEKNKVKMAEIKHKNSVALQKADQEFQIFLEEFKARLKGEKQSGTGQSGKASKEDYDKLRNMRNRYEKIYNAAVESDDAQSADGIKAKMDYIDKLLDYEEDPRYQYDWIDNDDDSNARSYLAAEKQGVTPEELKQWVQEHIPNKQKQHKFYDLVENIRKRWF